MSGRRQLTGGLAPEDFSPESSPREASPARPTLLVPTKRGGWREVVIVRRLKLCGLPGFVAHKALSGDTGKGRWVISHESGFAAGQGETIPLAKMDAESRLARSARIHGLSHPQELARVLKLALEEQAASR